MWCTNWQQYPGCIHSITPFPFNDRNFIILLIIIIIKLILLVSLPSLPILFFFYCSQHVHLFLLFLCRNIYLSIGFESWIWLAQVSFLSFALGFQRWILFSDIIFLVVYQTQNLMSFWLGKHLPKMSADQTDFCFKRGGGLPDLLQYYKWEGGVSRDPKFVLRNIWTAPKGTSWLTWCTDGPYEALLPDRWVDEHPGHVDGRDPCHSRPCHGQRGLGRHRPLSI